MSEQRSSDPTTREYVRMVLLNKLSATGLAIMLLAILFLWSTGPESGITNAATYGGGMLLLGGALFALGFSLGQRELVEKSPSWSWRRK